MKWLFLVHQVFTPNSRERVKVWRAIKKTGAVLHRNSVYVLPYGPERLEDFQWVCQEINDAKGDASVFVSTAPDPAEDAVLKTLFRKARDEDYAQLLRDADKLHRRVALAKKGRNLTERLQRTLDKEARQLCGQLDELRRIDFFSASPPGRITKLLDGILKDLASTRKEEKTAPVRRCAVKDFQNRVWATRKDIHIDRLCSAWLIRRFIDPGARFVFAAEDSLPEKAIRFDVFGAEFSHHGEDCTFETFLKAFRLRDPALRRIAEIIHDIDLKDGKFGRSEAAGLDLVIRSLADSVKNDHRLLEVGASILDGLHRSLSKR